MRDAGEVPGSTDPRGERLSPWNAPTVRALLWDRIVAAHARVRVCSALAVPGVPAPPDADGDAEGDLELDALGFDSLALIDLATEVAVQFGLHRTGLDAGLMTDRRLSAWIGLVLESRARDDARLGFLTSGSTGAPRLCEHPLAWLDQEIDFFATLLADRARVLRLVPVHHIYGFLFALALPARLGIPAADRRATLPTALMREARAGDLLVAHPAVLDLATRAPGRLAAGVTILTSASPCPAALWQRLRAAGVERVLDIHGSTETAGIGLREAADAPFQLLPHWTRESSVGEDTLLRRPPPGCAGANRTAPGGPKPGLAEWSRVEVPDRLAWVDERRFHVQGRRDQAIQIGGVNVFPERVRACLESHPEVAAALVRPAGAAPTPWLKALVVPRATCRDARATPAAWLARLEAWLGARLPPAERPRSIALARTLPRSALGKPVDWD